MNTKQLLTSCLLPLWVLSSFGAGPSRTLNLNETLSADPTLSIRQLSGMDVAFAGRIAGSAHGNLMLLLREPVTWTQADAEGTVSSVEASIFEYDPTGGTIVDAFAVLAPAGAEDEDAPTLDDLVFNAATQTYLGLDADTQRLYAFEYGPDQPVTIMVERTRMVEVVIPPESLLAQEAAEPEATEPQDSALEPEAPEAELESDAALPEPVEPDAEVETAMDAEAEAVMETDSEAVEVAVEAESGDEAASGEVVEPATASTDAAEPMGLAEDPGVTPIEVPEILEEVEETIVVKTQWVEETYEEPEVILERHKFGNALQSYDLSELGMQRIVDLSYDPSIDMLLVLGQDDEGGWLMAQIRAEGGQILTRGDAIPLHVKGNPRTVFTDPVSNHWVVVTDEAAEIYSRGGRLLRTIAHAMSVNDISFVQQVDVSGAATRTHYVATDSAVGPLQWDRPEALRVHHVPGEFASVQDAVNAAGNDDWILVSPGVYEESLWVEGKSVQLVSYFQLTGDLYFTEHTRIQSDGGVAVTLGSAEGSALYLAGLGFSGSETAIRSAGQLAIEYCEVIGNGTGFAFTGGTATIADCEITGNSGDGLSYADATATLVERCNISTNGGHGIAVQITPYDGVLYRTVIRRNTLRSNGGSGIYFKDQPVTTQREFRIENNFLIENGVAGVEVNLDQPDPKNLIPTGPRTRTSVFLVNNTIVGNPVGVLRGGNFRMINNIVARSSVAGIQNVLYNSAIIRNLFWENETHAIDSNFNAGNNREEDPLFVGEDYILSVRSPAKGAGIPGNLWNDTSDRSGADIGASR